MFLFISYKVSLDNQLCLDVWIINLAKFRQYRYLTLNVFQSLMYLSSLHPSKFKESSYRHFTTVRLKIGY